MGQICQQCSKTNEDEKTTFLFSNEKETNYDTKLDPKMAKSKNKGFTFNEDFYENKLSQLIIIQKYIIQKHIRKMVKTILPKENEEIYNRFLKDFTTSTLTNTESQLKRFKYVPSNKPANKLYYCKILVNYSKNNFYSGQVDIRSLKNGNGFLLQSDGTKFIGNWENDSLEGFGRIIDINGDLYEGNFVNSKLNGIGKMVSLDREYSYLGNWIDHTRVGKGKEETNEYSYEGDFINNKKEGMGKQYFKILEENYEGEFTNDEITGQGNYTWSNNNTFTGKFIKGMMNGFGIYNWQDGSYYKGSYNNNLKEGYGEYKMHNGKIYKGPFVDGKPHGRGVLEFQGKTLEVEFNEGKIIKNSQKKKI